VLVALVQTFLTLAVARTALGIGIRIDGLPLLVAAMAGGTAGWFFFYAIFALRIRRNDAFNTITSVFYFVFLFASSMFYPLEPLPRLLRLIALANPITWQVDVLRYASIGVGTGSMIAIEATAFLAFTVGSFVLALRALEQAG
jgi:ABC-2 type transport system permease protein